MNPTTTQTAPTAPARTWRTVDIVVAAVLAVAFGVAFWAWDLLWNGPAAAIPLPTRALLYGVWLIPGVLGGLIIRRPGAAFFTQSLAALVSVALGTAWGWTIAVQGPIEAVGAELAFLILAYRSFGLLAASLAAVLSGVVAGVYDIIYWYPASEYSTSAMRIPYVALTAASSLVLAGIGAWALTRALAQTGVLDRFPAGRERVAV